MLRNAQRNIPVRRVGIRHSTHIPLPTLPNSIYSPPPPAISSIHPIRTLPLSLFFKYLYRERFIVSTTPFDESEHISGDDRFFEDTRHIQTFLNGLMDGKGEPETRAIWELEYESTPSPERVKESQKGGAIFRNIHFAILPSSSLLSSSGHGASKRREDKERMEEQVMFTESMGFFVGRLRSNDSANKTRTDKKRNGESGIYAVHHTLPLECLSPYLTSSTRTHILSIPSQSPRSPTSNLPTSFLGISSLPYSDHQSSTILPPTLPVSPYPPPLGTPVLIPSPPTFHRVRPNAWENHAARPQSSSSPSTSTSTSDGELPLDWISSTITGYKDPISRAASPGTYDALYHVHLSTPLPPETIGAPILHAESGAVVGVVDSVKGFGMAGHQGGTREGLGEEFGARGLVGELLWEMFPLPGFKPKFG